MKKYSKSQLFAIMILAVAALCCLPSLSFSAGTDVDSDGNVDLDDVIYVLPYLGDPSSECPECDVDGNGQITANDILMVDNSCTLPGCATETSAYICSTFGDNPDNSSLFDTDIFKLYGAKGEQVTIFLVSDPLKTGWGKRALLTLSYRGLVKEDWSFLKPYNVINAKLPEDGWYSLSVTGKQKEGGNILLKGPYCILLENTLGIPHTIWPEDLVE